MKFIHLIRCNICYVASNQMWRIMKLIIIIMTVFLMQVSASSRAQVLTLKDDRISLKQVFSEIRKQTGYTVFCESEIIRAAKPISADFKNLPLEEALKRVLVGQNLNYDIQNKAITISKKEEPSFLDNIIRNIMAIDVRGRVTDENGQGLAGATVVVVGGKSTKTDQNGDFYLQGVDEQAVIKISYVGYKDVEVKAKKDLSVQMELKTGDLQEVVVNKGYYTTTEKLNTSSISSVKADDIAKAPVNNVLSALQGRVTGAVVTQNTGLPGGGFTVQVRGQNAIPLSGSGLIKNTNPFYVVDGVPYMDQTLGSVNSQLVNGNPLNFINVSDIESIDILKDADATAIYGSRGANGVVLITTKKGAIGAVKFNLNLYGGIGHVAGKAALMNTQQYIEMRKEAFRNDGIDLPSLALDPANRDYDVNGAWSQDRYTDWQKVFWGNNAQIKDGQFSVSGGNTNTQYLLGATWRKESTVLPGNSGDEKGGVHFSLNSQSVNQKLKFRFSGSYINDVNTVFGQSSFSDILLAPNAPELYNPDGSLNWAPLVPGGAGTFNNPMAKYLFQTYTGRTGNLISSGLISYEIISGLDIRVSAGYNNTRTDEISKNPAKMNDPALHITTNSAAFNNTESRSWIVEPQLNYTKKIAQGTLTGLLGGTFQEQRNQGTQINGSNFSSDAFLSDIRSAATIRINSSISNQYRYSALFGRLGYNWDEKYVINFTARRDASSRFGPDKQFANFFSTGVAWVFSEESFIKNSLPWLSFGKLRGSYGITGSDQIPDYYFMDLYSAVNNTYGGVKGLQLTRFFNPVLGWESTKKLEMGLELGFLKDRVRVDADFYRNRSNNQLLPLQLPRSTGFGSVITNQNGSVQNTGWEFLITSVNIRAKNFTWQSSINATIPKNKLLSYPSLSSGSYLVVGSPVTQSKIAHFTGVNPETGVYQFLDATGNNTSDFAEPTVFVNTSPKFYGGIQNSFHYKGFDFDFLLQYVSQKGRSLVSGINSPAGTFALSSGNQPVAMTDRWQSPQQNGKYQQFTQDFANPAYLAFYNIASSDFTYQDASFLRLKNVSFSWTLPSKWVSKAKLLSTRIYLQGQNLLTFTGYDGLDPETQGIAMPPLRVVTMGVQATF